MYSQLCQYSELYDFWRNRIIFNVFYIGTTNGLFKWQMADRILYVCALISIIVHTKTFCNLLIFIFCTFIIHGGSFLRFLMHQSFVSTAPLWPGISVFKALLKVWHCGVRFVVISLLLEPDNNVEQHLGVVLMKNKYERGS